MHNSISETVKNLAYQIETAKEEWLYKCINTLHYGLPFDKEQLKEYVVELIKKYKYKVYFNPNLNSSYLGYSYDFTEGIELKYIAEFTIAKEELTTTGLWSKEEILNHKEINSNLKIEYTLPLIDNKGNILKTTIKWNSLTNNL